MRRRLDPEEGADEVFDLWSAETTDDLRRVLVLHPPIRRTADAFEPYVLLSKHHKMDPTGSAETAMLMVTDPRWRDGVGNLIRRIEQSDILDDGQLDLLAEAFLAAGDAVYWQVPDHWFSDEGIAIWVDESDEVDEVDEVDERQDDAQEDEGEGRPAVVRRTVPPPLRRWAAGRLVKRQPERWGQILSRVRALDASAAAAAMSGLLDVVSVLQPATQEFLIEKGTSWPDHSVRRLGIGLVAERKGVEAAHAIAICDPNAGVRKWAGSLLEPPAPREDTEKEKPAVQAPEPPTLF